MIRNKRALYDLIAEGYEKEYDEAHYIHDTKQPVNPFFGPEVDFQEDDCEGEECDYETQDATCPSCGTDIGPAEDYQYEEEDSDETDDILADISDKLDSLIDVILGDEYEEDDTEDDEDEDSEEDDEVEIEEIENDEDDEEDDSEEEDEDEDDSEEDEDDEEEEEDCCDYEECDDSEEDDDDWQ